MHGPQDFGEFRDGDVLVAKATAPAWTLMFTRAAAIVTDAGTLAAQASLVAREYAIPAVVGTGDATVRLHSGAASDRRPLHRNCHSSRRTHRRSVVKVQLGGFHRADDRSGNVDRGPSARPASQIASQSVQHPAVSWVHPRTSLTPTAALSGVPEITDTEEVTGSNPVSPTMKALVSDSFAAVTPRLALGSVDLSA